MEEKGSNGTAEGQADVPVTSERAMEIRQGREAERTLFNALVGAPRAQVLQAVRHYYEHDKMIRRIQRLDREGADWDKVYLDEDGYPEYSKDPIDPDVLADMERGAFIPHGYPAVQPLGLGDGLIKTLNEEQMAMVDEVLEATKDLTEGPLLIQHLKSLARTPPIQAEELVDLLEACLPEVLVHSRRLNRYRTKMDREVTEGFVPAFRVFWKYVVRHVNFLVGIKRDATDIPLLEKGKVDATLAKAMERIISAAGKPQEMERAFKKLAEMKSSRLEARMNPITAKKLKKHSRTLVELKVISWPEILFELSKSLGMEPFDALAVSSLPSFSWKSLKPKAPWDKPPAPEEPESETSSNPL